MKMKFYQRFKFILIILLDSCFDEIRQINEAQGKEENLEKLSLSRESLHTIGKKLKKAIFSKEIDSIKRRHYKVIEKHKDKLEELSKNLKFQNIRKKDLKNFVFETCKIDGSGKVFRVLMKIK